MIVLICETQHAFFSIGFLPTETYKGLRRTWRAIRLRYFGQGKTVPSEVNYEPQNSTFLP